MDTNQSIQGIGVLLHRGKIYEGFFKDNKKDGLGRQCGSKGDIYDGYWRNDKKCGFGVMEIVDKKYKYVGDWKNDQFDGIGNLITDDAVYEGEWKENKQHGKGNLVYADGRVYTGAFRKGVIQGYGTLIWPNGHGYAGQWEAGEMVGVGTKITKKIKSLYDPDMKVYKTRLDSYGDESVSFVPESEVADESLSRYDPHEISAFVPDESVIY